MARADTPEDVSRLIGETVSAGDVDEALSLYEPGGTFAMPYGFGEGSVTGHEELRGALTGFTSMNPELKVNAEKTLLSGDIALVTGNWTLKGRGPDGSEVNASGRYADVVRRQPDGNWLFVIDNPNGHD